MPPESTANGMLVGKKALITGAASGIGAAAARAFVAEGATVFLTDIDADGLAAVAAELGQAHCPANLCREEEVEALVKDTVGQLGGLDCAFNNAGVTQAASGVESLPLAEWQRLIDINLTSVFLCMKYELQHMQGAGGGAIVNTASGAGVVGPPLMAAYTAAKHGVLGLTKTAAAENSSRNIRVNAILPGSTQTPMLQSTLDMGEDIEQVVRKSIPCGRFGTAQEIAQAALWLCSDRASYVSGESMLVDMATVCR
jgi:NAD(P)-dependent dehydrogenase (short-subunit alcohol dehydrogenase family)